MKVKVMDVIQFFVSPCSQSPQNLEKFGCFHFSCDDLRSFF